MFKPVSKDLNFSSKELETLKYWKDNNIFDLVLSTNKDNTPFVFYEGPPTANGSPHNGHVFTRVMKDVILRYKTMNGFSVDRKAGWDTHGLPVEVEVEKALNIHGKQAIEEYGVKPFTEKCLASVFKYTTEWESLTERIGFWVDLDKAYATYHTSYVESVWWALSELYKKGLLYQGHRVCWWWPQGGTALSAAEVGQNYKEVQDLSAYVAFPIIYNSSNASLVIWTTTPWTLSSNMFVAVNPTASYSLVNVSDSKFIIASDLLELLAVKFKWDYTIESSFLGEELVGLKYQTPHSVQYNDVLSSDIHQVVSDSFVSTKDGTGLVHIAPAFGDTDYSLYIKVMTNLNVKIPLLCAVATDGKFNSYFPKYQNRLVKSCDKDIVNGLKQDGSLVLSEMIKHEYPFCWRADNDALIQYARPAWYIKTSAFKDQALANNATINWMPEHIKNGRFGNFLSNNVDWALSRERYWGTPLNIWKCKSCNNKIAPSSVAEIVLLNPNAFEAFYQAQALENLDPHLMVHKPWIDQVVLPCQCGAEMHRVSEVIDCWFDSGCMPFAQWGFPHQNQDKFRSNFPADFISEAIDQTRGWFYSLLMVSTLLFDQETCDQYNLTKPDSPYKNCMVLGHVADKTGKKESKSKGNYTSPNLIMGDNAPGADAFRWFFYTSSGSTIRNSIDSIKSAQKEFLIKLQNVYSFFVIYANLDNYNKEVATNYSKLDKWILSELNFTIDKVSKYMDSYQIYESSQVLIEFVESLSNWYVRRSRDRFWATGLTEDKKTAYYTLHTVLLTLSKLIAPFVPFFAEEMYQNLSAEKLSVHLESFPIANEFDLQLSNKVKNVRSLVSLGQAVRSDSKIKVRQPLQRAHIITAETLDSDDLSELKEEFNVLEIVVLSLQDSKVSQFINFKLKPNFRTLGLKGKGKEAQLLKTYLSSLSDSESLKLMLDLNNQDVEINNVFYSLSDLEIELLAKTGYSASSSKVGIVVLELGLTQQLKDMCLIRELISKIQGLRKESCQYSDRINLVINCSDELKQLINLNTIEISKTVLAKSIVFDCVEYNNTIEGHQIGISLTN